MFIRYIAITLGFTFTITAFFSPVLFSGSYFTAPGDGSNLALPAFLGAHHFWEPDIMLGYPWASNFNGFWDPLFQLRFLPHTFNLYMLCAYVIAAIGTFGCTYAITKSTIGGFIAGLSYSLGGFMIGHSGHYDIVHPAAWTPFVLWALIVQRSDQSPRPIAFGSIAIGMCAVAGQPQVLAYTLALAIAYVLFTVNGSPAKFLFNSIVTLLLGAGLGAIALLPGALLAHQSFRAQPSLEYFLAYSIPVWQIPIRLFFPYLVSRTDQSLYPLSTSSIGSDAEFSAYVGITTIILAFIAVFTRRIDHNVVFITLAAAIALILSTGDGFHVAELTFHVPLFNLFRAQGRHMLEFTLLVSILGGIGAAEISKFRVSYLRIVLGSAIVGFVAAMSVASAERMGTLPANGNSDLVHNPAFLIPAAVFCCGGAMLCMFKRHPTSVLMQGALACFILLDIGTFSWFQYWRSPVSQSSVAPPPVVEMLRPSLSETHQRIFSVGGATPGGGIPPNLSLLWGVPAAGGYVQLLLTSPGIFLQLFPQGTISPELLLNGADRSFNLASIRYVVISSDQAAAVLKARPEWRRFQSDPTNTILENTEAEPRVRIVHRVLTESPDDALRNIRQNTYDSRHVAIISEPGAIKTATDKNDNAAIKTLVADQMVVAVTCRTLCFLETSDNYNGMWQASIDAHKVPLLLTDYTLRGVFVPPGKHVVMFTYRPWSLALGGAFTILSACIVAFLFLTQAMMARSAYLKANFAPLAP